ncbi:hypothetical protein ACPPVV_17650 [Rhodanobacter sp. Col0626]|uniref:hypothetical protein n=1 Tax=Rhodanobacter sp. Col0626 TaxID=3415679 RepID=UPI003CEF6064
MKFSTFNVAVLVQFFGLLVLGFAHDNILRAIGAAVIIVGGVLYRREQKRVKSTQPSASIAPVDSGQGSEG